MKLTRAAMARPITTLMLFACFIVSGVIATRLLPMEFFPEVQFPGIFVQVPYPNSTAEEIERTITRPIEEVLSTMTGIRELESTSTDDQASVELLFDWSQNPKIKGVEAREKLDAIRDELPDDLRRLMVFTGSTADMPLMQLRVSSKRDLSNAYELLDRKLKRPLERVEGVSRVDLYGVAKREIQIQLIPERVTAHQIDVPSLLAQLQQINFSKGAGDLRTYQQNVRVKPIGEYQTIEDYGNTYVAGTQLRLKDIADIQYAEPLLEDGRHLDRTYAIGMSIMRESSANMVAVADRVLATVAEIQNSSDFDGINLYIMDNAAEGVLTSLSDISMSGLIGFLLSIAVLYFFLRQLSITLIVALAVPFSLCITLAVMYFWGLTLNVLSMMGLMLAIGMLVDNAVVITENIFHKKREMPDQPVEASIKGVNEVGIAVLAGTVTTGIVFLPNIIGEKIDITVFLSHVAVAICISLLASLLIAITIIPLLLNKVKVNKELAEPRLLVWLKARYANGLHFMVSRPKVGGWIAAALFFSAIIPLKNMNVDMFPEEHRANLMLHYNLNSVYTLEKVETYVDLMEEYLYQHQEEFQIESVYSYYRTDLAQSTLILKPKEERDLSVKEIRERIEANLPKIAIGAPAFQRGGNSEDGLSVQLTGESTEVLKELTEEVARILNEIPGIKDARSEASNGEQVVKITVNREKAQRLGLTPLQVADTVAVAMRGQNLRTLRTGEGEVQVKLLFTEEQGKGLAELYQVPIARPTGPPIPLSTVANFTVEQGTESITRLNRTTMMLVKANLKDLTLDESRDLIRPILDSLSLPPGYAWSFGRGIERSDKAGSIMGQNMLLAMLMIFVVMAALFESLLFPLAVITSIFYSFVGVFWFFFITGTTLSFTATVGMLVLMGVVVNNGIVLVDHINQLRLAGMERARAIQQAGQDRLRPILMTVATTILGLVPLSIGDAAVGGNGPPYYPMARAVIGGLLYATVISLLVLPVIYIGLDNLSVGAARLWRNAKTAVLGNVKA